MPATVACTFESNGRHENMGSAEYMAAQSHVHCFHDVCLKNRHGHKCSNGFQPKPGGKRYAACVAHLNAAVIHFDGTTVSIRVIMEPEDDKLCVCGKLADFFFTEVEVKGAN